MNTLFQWLGDRGSITVRLGTVRSVRKFVVFQASNSSRPSFDPCSCTCCTAVEQSGLICVPGGAKLQRKQNESDLDKLVVQVYHIL